MRYTTLLKGGRVLDPSQGLDTIADLALSDGRIAAIAPSITIEIAEQTFDVAGLLVIPGLVDLHAHVFAGISALGLDPDTHWLAKGVTTIVDAGSAGAINIAGFRRFIVEPARARILALLNISAIGMPFLAVNMSEVGWLPLLDVDLAVEAIRAHADLVAGLKVRMTRYLVGETGVKPLDRALEAAERAGLPLMMHIGDSPAPVGDLLDRLRPGDILTHSYTAFAGIEYLPNGAWRALPSAPRGRGISILDAEGKVIPQAWAARRRGVIIDVGHGMGSFSFEVFRDAIKEGFAPDTIGTDLHAGSLNGPVYDMPCLISRFLSLGMSLRDVIAACTSRPAQALGLRDGTGTLRAGAAGDVAVFELKEGHFEYQDSTGATLIGAYRLAPRWVFKDGALVARDGALTGD